MTIEKMAPNNLGSSTIVLSETSIDSENCGENSNQNVANSVDSPTIESTDQKVSAGRVEKDERKMCNTIYMLHIVIEYSFYSLSKFMQRQSYFQFEFKDIVWKNVIIFLYLHGAAIYGVYLLATGEAKLMTFVLGMI